VVGLLTIIIVTSLSPLVVHGPLVEQIVNLIPLNLFLLLLPLKIPKSILFVLVIIVGLV